MSLYEGMVRLAWLDLRNIRKILITSVITPAVLFCILQQFKEYSNVYGVVCNIPVLLISLLVILWATGKTGVRSEKSVYESRFPISPKLVWTFRFVVSLVVTTLIGIWFTACFSYWRDRTISGELCLNGAMYFSVLFICCHVLSAFMPRYSVILIALLWTLYGYNLGVTQMDNSGLMQSWKTDMLFRMLTGGLIALLFARKRILITKPRWRLATILMILFISATYTDIVALIQYGADEPEVSYQTYQQDSTSVDGSVNAKTDQLYGGWRSEKYGKYLGVSCRDYKTERQSFWTLKKDIGVIDTTSKGNVFLAQQLPESADIRILVGSCKGGPVREVTQFRAKRDALIGILLPEIKEPLRTRIGSVSPDENRMLLSLASPLGQGMDLWAINMETHISRVVMANYPGYLVPDFTWNESLAYVSRLDIQIAVDFKSLSSKPIYNLIK